MSGIQPDNRFVDTAPWFDEADLSAPERSDMDAPGWLLTWRKFKRHKIALISAIFLLTCYLILPIAGFIAPYTPNERSADYLYAPPQSINLWHEGSFIGPYVYPIKAEADLVNFGKKPALHEEMEKLAVDEEIEKELQALKSPVPQKDEKTRE